MDSPQPEAIRDLLGGWVRSRVPPDAWDWLAGAARAAERGSVRDSLMAFGLVSRKVGKADLAPTGSERAEADALRPGWDPSDWSVDQAARLFLVLAAEDGSERLADLVEQLCRTADVAELIALYRGLPLYPRPHLYRRRAAEGARTNMKAVFAAVAHRNPYPAEQFPEDAWNQMVLKALFIGAPLHPIRGLDRRANPRLASMLRDYAHERWAAHRPVSVELWRCVGPFADEGALRDLERVLDSPDRLERGAGALALMASGHPVARGLLARTRERWEPALAEAGTSWEELARRSCA